MLNGIFLRTDMIFEFDFKPGPLYRTMGPGGSRELIGAGFMRKRPGSDHTDYDPPMYSLCYIVSGHGTYSDNSGTYRLTAGTYFQRMPGNTHSTHIDDGEPWIECFIDFGTALYGTLCRMGMIDRCCPCGTAGINRSIVEAVADFRRLLESCEQDELRLIMPRLLDLHQRIIISKTAQTGSGDQAVVSRISQILGKDLDCRLDIRMICRDNGWGYEKMRKLFKVSMGISPAQYRLRRRLDEARRLLLTHREMPINEIAAILGYTNVYEFSAQFKKFTGLPPGKFRNS